MGKEGCPQNRKYTRMNTTATSSFFLHREGNYVKKYPRIRYNCSLQNLTDIKNSLINHTCCHRTLPDYNT